MDFCDLAKCWIFPLNATRVSVKKEKEYLVAPLWAPFRRTSSLALMDGLECPWESRHKIKLFIKTYLIGTSPGQDPSKHCTRIQCWFNAGPASQTLDQHWTNTGWIRVQERHLERESQLIFSRPLFDLFEWSRASMHTIIDNWQWSHPMQQYATLNADHEDDCPTLESRASSSCCL